MKQWAATGPKAPGEAGGRGARSPASQGKAVATRENTEPAGRRPRWGVGAPLGRSHPGRETIRLRRALGLTRSPGLLGGFKRLAGLPKAVQNCLQLLGINIPVY